MKGIRKIHGIRVLTTTHVFWAILLAASVPVIAFALAHQRQVFRYLLRQRHRSMLLLSILWRATTLALVVVVATCALSFIDSPTFGNFPVKTLAAPDGAESASLREIQALPESAWQSSRSMSFGALTLSPGTTWLKLSLPVADASVDYVASLAFPFVESVEFSLSAGGASTKSERFGTDLPETGERAFDVHPTFTFTVPEATPAELYVRVLSVDSHAAPLQVTTRAAHSRDWLRSRIIEAILLGAVAGCLLFNASLFLSLRENIYRQYVAFQTPILISVMAYHGMLPVEQFTQYPMAVNQAVIILSIHLAMAAYAHFLITAVDLEHDFPWLARSTRAVIPFTLIPVAFFPLLSLTERVYATVASLLFLGVAAAFGMGILLSRAYGFRYVLGSIGLATGMILHLLTRIEILPGSPLADQIIGLGAAWDAVVVSSAISARINAMRADHHSLLRTLAGDGTADPKGATPAAAHEVESRLRVVIMVIDIANFTLITDKVGSGAVYNALARRMRQMRTIIRELGGTVDRSLGDGLLCFFAQASNEGSEAVARRALDAAIRIQLQSIEAPIDRHLRGVPVAMPLRIGIHTDEVLIGNLGSASRLDFTIMGRGVHLTQQLESAGNPFKIMLSSELCRALGDLRSLGHGMNTVHIAGDIDDTLLLAHEFNPFVATPELLQRAERQIAEFLGQTRDLRKSIAEGSASLTSSHGRFAIKNMSLHGFGVVSEKLIGRKVTLWVRIDAADQDRQERLRGLLLESIQVEVRWCREVGGVFEHGLRIVGLNHEQKHELFDCLLPDHAKGGHDSPIALDHRRNA